MSTSIEVKHICGKARRLALDNLQTPTVFFQTSGGFQPYLSMDLLNKLPETPSFYMPFGDLYPILETMKRSGKTLNQVTALKDNFLHVQFRNLDNFNSYKFGNKGLGFSTKEGNRDILVDDYYNFMNIIKPSSFTCLSDEVSLNVGVRKGNQSIVNTEKWIDRGLELNKTQSLIFGGINVNRDENRFITHLNNVINKTINGISINGLYLGESEEEREKFLSIILNTVPQNKIRLLTGPQTPIEILESFNKGIDIVPCSYPLYMTEKGQASIFWNGSNNEINEEVDHNILDLTDIRYENDHNPIEKGCSCYACSNFTRGYIHHLLDVHELLGFILILQHNMHHTLNYIQNIRSHIDNDTIEEYTQSFINHYKQH